MRYFIFVFFFKEEVIKQYFGRLIVQQFPSVGTWRKRENVEMSIVAASFISEQTISWCMKPTIVWQSLIKILLTVTQGTHNTHPNVVMFDFNKKQNFKDRLRITTDPRSQMTANIMRCYACLCRTYRNINIILTIWFYHKFLQIFDSSIFVFPVYFQVYLC